jgi:predicted nucleotidyltransferase component of viral defense system
MPLSARQVVEFFHLSFLRALTAKSEEKALVALKGGSNLRFYFGSVRYSEDIDFDVVVMARETLKNKIDRLLRSPALTLPLRTKGIEVAESSAPKQTDTTQRWKLGLHAAGFPVTLRTKIEFSRRDSIEGAAFESVDRAVLMPYAMTSTLATHYTTHAAIAQKVQALAGRTEPQARDVFDLSVLLARPDSAKLALSKEKPTLSLAIERAMSISFDEYRSKVVAFLDPDQVDLYAQRATWEAMQESTVARLEALQ